MVKHGTNGKHENDVQPATPKLICNRAKEPKIQCRWLRFRAFGEELWRTIHQIIPKRVERRKNAGTTRVRTKNEGKKVELLGVEKLTLPQATNMRNYYI